MHYLHRCHGRAVIIAVTAPIPQVRRATTRATKNGPRSLHAEHRALQRLARTQVIQYQTVVQPRSPTQGRPSTPAPLPGRQTGEPGGGSEWSTRWPGWPCCCTGSAGPCRSRAAERDDEKIARWREATWPVIEAGGGPGRLALLPARVGPEPEAAEGPHLGAARPDTGREGDGRP
jgi:hypothetical protein